MTCSLSLRIGRLRINKNSRFIHWQCMYVVWVIDFRKLGGRGGRVHFARANRMPFPGTCCITIGELQLAALALRLSRGILDGDAACWMSIYRPICNAVYVCMYTVEYNIRPLRNRGLSRDSSGVRFLALGVGGFDFTNWIIDGNIASCH